MLSWFRPVSTMCCPSYCQPIHYFRHFCAGWFCVAIVSNWGISGFADGLDWDRLFMTFLLLIVLIISSIAWFALSLADLLWDIKRVRTGIMCFGTWWIVWIPVGRLIYFVYLGNLMPRTSAYCARYYGGFFLMMGSYNLDVMSTCCLATYCKKNCTNQGGRLTFSFTFITFTPVLLSGTSPY